MMEIVPYRPEKKKEWERLIKKALNSTFLHSRNFMDYHGERFVDGSLMAYVKDQLVAVLPANIDQQQVYSHQGLTYGGFLVDRELTTIMMLRIVAEFLRYYKEKGFHTFILKSPPCFYGGPGQEVIEYALFVLGAEIVRTDLTYAVELPVDGEHFSKRRKRGIKGGELHGVEIKKTDRFDRFWQEVLVPNLRERHHTTPVHKVEEITYLCRTNPGAIHQYEACFQDQVVAGITVFETEKVAHTQYIASTVKGREVHALDVLVNRLMTVEFGHKSYFNFGIVNENEGTFINKGLMEWKESFGAKPYVHKFYRVETAAYKELYKLVGE